MCPTKRFAIIFVVAATIVFVLACQSVSNIVSPATPVANVAPELTSGVFPYDGDWKGTTSQNFKINFTVRHNEITDTTVRVQLIGSTCVHFMISSMITLMQFPTPETGNAISTRFIQNGAFAIAGSEDDGNGISSVSFIGTFSSPNSASGTLEYVRTGTDCDGKQIVEWTAEKGSH